MLRQRKLHLIICIILGFSFTVEAQEVKFAQTSIDNIKRASKSLDKPFFVYLHDVDSPDCRLMETTTFQDEDVVNTLNNYMLPLQIDISSKEGRKIVKRQNIQLTPAILFYDDKGKVMMQQESTIKSADFLKIIDLLYDIEIAHEELVQLKQPVVEETKVIAAKIETAPEETTKTEGETQKESVKTNTISAVDIPRKTLKVKAGEMPRLNDKILDDAKKNKLKSPNQLFSESEKKPKEIITANILKREVPALSTQSALMAGNMDMSGYVEFESNTVDYSLPPQNDENDQMITENTKVLPTTRQALLMSIHENHKEAKGELVKLDNSGIEKFKLKRRYRKPSPRMITKPKASLVSDVVTKTVVYEKKKPVRKSVGSSQRDRVLQMGAFYKYDDVLKSMYQIKKKTDADITIIEEITKGKKMYKLVTIELMNLSQANNLAKSFKEKQIDCFIRKAN